MFIFTKVNLSSGIVCRQFIRAFRKQFLKPFGLDQPEAILLQSSDETVTRRDSHGCPFFRSFFSLYIFRRTISPFWLFRQQYLFRYRNFHFSLRFDGLEITLVQFRPLFTWVLLCLHFTFLSLTEARGAIFKIVFFAELKLQVQLKEAEFFHIV